MLTETSMSTAFHSFPVLVLALKYDGNGLSRSLFDGQRFRMHSSLYVVSLCTCITGTSMMAHSTIVQSSSLHHIGICAL